VTVSFSLHQLHTLQGYARGTRSPGKKDGSDPRFRRSDPVFVGGAEGIRTPDLLIANGFSAQFCAVSRSTTGLSNACNAWRSPRGRAGGERSRRLSQTDPAGLKRRATSSIAVV